MLVPDSALTLARIADAPAIAERSRTLIETGLPWSWVPRRVEASIRHPETNVVVARVREGIAGFGIMWYGLEEAHLNLLRRGPRLARTRDRAAPAGVAGAAGAGGRSRPDRPGGAGGQRRRPRLLPTARVYRTLERVPGYHGGREAALRMGRAP